jgi:electron transfer flavoprotein alpha/beta subunit
VNIIVCIKQVPDTEAQIKIASDGKSIVKEDIKWVNSVLKKHCGLKRNLEER